jgi:hypothetical protein
LFKNKCRRRRVKSRPARRLMALQEILDNRPDAKRAGRLQARPSRSVASTTTPEWLKEIDFGRVENLLMGAVLYAGRFFATQFAILLDQDCCSMVSFLSPTSRTPRV